MEGRGRVGVRHRLGRTGTSQTSCTSQLATEALYPRASWPRVEGSPSCARLRAVICQPAMEHPSKRCRIPPHDTCATRPRFARSWEPRENESSHRGPGGGAESQYGACSQARPSASSVPGHACTPRRTTPICNSNLAAGWAERPSVGLRRYSNSSAAQNMSERATRREWPPPN